MLLNEILPLLRKGHTVKFLVSCHNGLDQTYAVQQRVIAILRIAIREMNDSDLEEGRGQQEPVRLQTVSELDDEGDKPGIFITCRLDGMVPREDDERAEHTLFVPGESPGDVIEEYGDPWTHDRYVESAFGRIPNSSGPPEGNSAGWRRV